MKFILKLRRFCSTVKPSMEPKYWLGRWDRGETGWHQTEVDAELITYFGQLTSTRVLVPFCGKSLDLKWLIDQGHEVIGVELSTAACEAFFAENEMKYQRFQEGEFTVFRADNITIYNGDFFAFKQSHLKSIGALYDRAALIALPAEMRTRYAAHIVALVQAAAAQEFAFLEIVIERTPHDEQGPPFSVPSGELERLYGSTFKIVALSRERIELEGVSSLVEECIYILKPLSNVN